MIRANFYWSIMNLGETWFHFLFSRYNLSQHVYYANFQSQKVIKNVLPTKLALLD